MIVSIIPARANSVRLPGKNMRPMCGKPLIQHTIEQSLAAGDVAHTFVSSDSDEILALAKTLGARGIKRPDSLATSAATARDACRHALEHVGNAVGMPERFVYLQPTSPLRLVEDISLSIKLAREQDLDAVASFMHSEISPNRLWRFDGAEMVPYLEGASPFDRRQEQPDALVLNGAAYVCRTSKFLSIEKGSFLQGTVRPYLMPPERSVDIDDLFDFVLAEAIMQSRGNEAGQVQYG